MPDTSTGYFNTVIEIAGPGSFLWTDLPNIQAEPGFASSFQDTVTIRCSDPASGLEIPGGNDVTHITVELLTSKGASASPGTGTVTIAGGTQRTVSVTEPPNSTDTLTGDLAYWGITQQQANDFAAGTGFLDYFESGPDNGIQTSVSYIRLRFTYQPSTAKTVPAPVLF